MSLLDRKQLIESYKPPTGPKVKRTPESYTDMYEVTVRDLNQLLDEYQVLLLDHGIRSRWHRDRIEWSIKRYQKYCIEQNIGSHYHQVDVSLHSRDVTVEHALPATVVRSMLIDKLITIDQAINSPICKVSREFNKRLNVAGLVKSSPNPWFFFTRYTSASKFSDVPVPGFQTYNGKVVDPVTWSLHDHYVYFGIAVS